MAYRQAVALAFLIAVVVEMPVASAGQPSFDCAKARTWSEVTVCNDAGLADLDRRVAELYRSNKAALPGEQQESVTRDQRQWLRDRESCKKQADRSRCLADLYKARIAQLGGEPERHTTGGVGRTQATDGGALSGKIAEGNAPLTSNSQETGVVNAPGDGFLSLRSEPSTQRGRRLVKIPHGTPLTLEHCDAPTGGYAWCRTTYAGQHGWVSNRYLSYAQTDSVKEILQAVSAECTRDWCEASVDKVRDGYAALSFKCTKKDCEGASAFAKRVNGRWTLATYGTGLTSQDLIEFGFPAAIADELLGEKKGIAAEALDHVTESGSLWGYGLGLSAANALAESGGGVAHKVASSATVDNAAARVDAVADKGSTVEGGGHTVPKMRAINLEASTLELPPPRSSDVVDEHPVAPASPEEVVSKLRETLGATSQSEWIATHYEKELLVDKETVHYGRSRRGATYADLEFGIGFSNMYTLDCEKRQFLRTKTIKWSDGWVQDMPMGEKWWPLQPSTTEMNAVYEAICPNLLAAVSGASPQVNSESIENKVGAVATGAVLGADRLEVKDGSALTGKIAEGKVPFKSSLGKIEISVEDIRSFTDGKLHLADGTVLTGTFAGGSIEIAASIGKLEVPAKEIVAILRQGQGEEGGVSAGSDAATLPPGAQAAIGEWLNWLNFPEGYNSASNLQLELQGRGTLFPFDVARGAGQVLCVTATFDMHHRNGVVVNKGAQDSYLVFQTGNAWKAERVGETSWNERSCPGKYVHAYGG